ncbi:HalOD1 output domain-containing protein [Halorubrum xinjiangense]|uniref:HalOD1 output domain-containing protein n=1 Tax=Halorubrum xinjiangense TaxID=261291 RepID=UPI00122D84E4|nr:HalOD1 output domain-containing protein [Halorubrum xinjiangense]
MAQLNAATAHVDNVTYEVVTRVAEVEDVDPVEVTPPLNEVIDPEALNQIFASTPTGDRMEGQVTFPYNGYEITVSGDGSVSVQ